MTFVKTSRPRSQRELVEIQQSSFESKYFVIAFIPSPWDICGYNPKVSKILSRAPVGISPVLSF